MKQNQHFLLVLLIIAIPIWAHLSELPIQLWDESRLANNSYEMYKNHNWLITHYNGEPDMWNTKPPLLIWLQVLCYHIFGVNELAFRFPSAAAGTATCLLLYWFMAVKMRNSLLGIFVNIVLITSVGFTRYHHGVRAGDYDSLLVFCGTAYLLFYYLFLEEAKQKYLYLTFIFLILAVMTKSIAGVIFYLLCFFIPFTRGSYYLC